MCKCEDVQMCKWVLSKGSLTQHLYIHALQMCKYEDVQMCK